MMFSKTFCILPWIHLLGGFTGQWQTCCCVAKFDTIATSEQSILDAWNSPKLRAIRLKMLEGRRIEQCSLCYSLEKSRTPSYRTNSNLFWKHHMWKVDETKNDGTVTYPLIYLDIRFSNLCNLRCRMCSHYASSSWYEDATTLGEASSQKVTKQWNENELFWDQVKNEILPSLELLYFAGGEPLIQDEHYKMLNMLLEVGRTDARLLYSTNLSTIDYKNYDLIDIWKEFEHVSVSASIDGVGEKGDYIRKGLHWHHWLENAQKLGKYLRGYAPAISVYNMYHLPELHVTIQDKFPGIEDRSGLVSFPEFLSIQIFDHKMKREIEAKYRTFLKQNDSIPSNVKSNMISWVNYMTSVDKSHLAKSFKEYNSKLDDLRSESFCDIFPELAEWYGRI